ncbi:MAG: glucoamylase family protein [Saprospiraceae bacterium]
MEKYGYSIPLRHKPQITEGRFWSHYSFLGLDPRNLKDKYADYWKHNVAHVMIDYEYCVENPLKYPAMENALGLDLQLLA